MKSIWYNGLVYTGEDTFQTAFLVEDGIFRAVGSDAEILALADEGTVCKDLKGQFVCPGFNQPRSVRRNPLYPHIHAFLSSIHIVFSHLYHFNCYYLNTFTTIIPLIL